MSLKLVKGGSIALLCKFASSRLMCGVYGTVGAPGHMRWVCADCHDDSQCSASKVCMVSSGRPMRLFWSASAEKQMSS